MKNTSMSKKPSVKKNYLYQVIYQILTILIALVTSPYLTRVIGATGTGIYGFHYNIANYFGVFALLGIANYGNRAIAQTRDNRQRMNATFSSILVLHLLISSIVLGVYVLYAGLRTTERIYAFTQVFYVLSTLLDISWFYFGIEAFKSTVLRNIAVKILNAIFIFVLVKGPADTWKYCLIMAFGYFISQLVLWVPLRRYVSFVKPTWKETIRHLQPMLVLFVPTIAISLYKIMDKLMIGWLSTKAQLGFYDNSEKIVQIPLAFISSFGTVMLPKMSNMVVTSDRATRERYISQSMYYVMCIAFAFAFGIASVGRMLAPIYWGEEFRPAGVILMGLSITMPFMAFANVIRTQYLIPNHKDKLYMSSVIGGALVNLVLNATLIPRLGAWGATIGTIAAEGTVCVIQSFSVRKEISVGGYLKNALPFLGLGTVMFAAVYTLTGIVRETILNLLLVILAGAVIYSLGSLLLFAWKKDPILQRLYGLGSRFRK